MRGELEDGWDSIPFENEEERSNLKRCFGICAKKEMENLGMTSEQRKGGIPTLVVFDKTTSVVLSKDAIPDLMGDTKIDDPLAHWKSLLPKKDGDP